MTTATLFEGMKDIQSRSFLSDCKLVSSLARNEIRLQWLNSPHGVALWSAQGSLQRDEAILLLHGGNFSTLSVFDSSYKSYSLMVNLARQSYAVFGLDFNGYGLSPLNRVAHDYKAYIDEAVLACQNLRKMGYRKVFVVGWSFGSHIAANLPIHADIDKVVLWGGFWGGGEKGKPGFISSIKLPEMMFRSNNEANASSDFQTPHCFEPELKALVTARSLQVDPESPTLHLHAVKNEQALYDPSKIDCPLLYTHGEFDRISNEQDTLEALAKIPHQEKSYVIMKNAEHNTQFNYRKDDFVALLSTFFRHGLNHPPMSAVRI